MSETGRKMDQESSSQNESLSKRFNCDLNSIVIWICRSLTESTWARQVMLCYGGPGWTGAEIAEPCGTCWNTASSVGPISTTLNSSKRMPYTHYCLSSHESIRFLWWKTVENGTWIHKNTSLQCLTLLVGWQEGHPACKKLGVGLLVVTIWLELCASYSSSCHHHLQHSASIKYRMETFW